MDTPPAPSRYHRQMLVPSIGERGQERLSRSSVLLIGCGALGTVIAEYLARAGVGHLRVADRDLVELSNLQRQTLFDEEDVAQQLPKAIAAANRLRRINSAVNIEPLVVDVHPGNIEQFLTPDLILDGTDNAPTRYLINDVAIRHNIPWVYGGAVGLEGRVMPVIPGQGPCLRCLFPAPPAGGELPTCDTAGVLGPVAGLIGSIQASIAIQLLASGPGSVPLDLLTIDLARNRFRTVSIADGRSNDCPCCGHRQFDFLDAPDAASVSLCGRNAVQIRPLGPFDFAAARARLQRAGALEEKPYFAQCRLHDPQGLVLTVFPDGRLIVSGTSDPTRARSIASRFVGI